MSKTKDIIQRHHLIYQKGKFEEKTGEIVLLFKGEHFCITQMQRRKKISRGFLKALRFWIQEVESQAIDLE